MKPHQDEQRPAAVEYSATDKRAIATIAALAALKRWLAAVDALERKTDENPRALANLDIFIWPLVRRKQQALKALEEAARALELAS